MAPKISDPSPADPTHHHALKPSRYASPVAPSVEPAPMFAASIEAKMSAGPRLRPAKKKALLLRTNLAVQMPRPTTPDE